MSEVNEKQFEKNKKWIQEQVSKQHPGVKVVWNGCVPSIELPEECWPQHELIIKDVQDLIERCGGDAQFYPEKAHAKGGT